MNFCKAHPLHYHQDAYKFLIMNRILFPRDVLFLKTDAWNGSSTCPGFSGVKAKRNPPLPDRELPEKVNEHKYPQHEQRIIAPLSHDSGP